MALLLKNVLFTVLIPGTVGVYVPLWLTWGQEPAAGILMIVSIVLLACGAATYIWSVWGFAWLGGGTPLPLDAPKQLVITGPYRFTRNPMYVGVLLLILGWSVLFLSRILLLYAVFVFLCFHIMIVTYEEKHLRSEFGISYDEYCKRVGRWFSITYR